MLYSPAVPDSHTVALKQQSEILKFLTVDESRCRHNFRPE